MRTILAVLTGVASLSASAGLQGQIVRGEVADSVTNQALPGVSVTLIDTQGRSVDQMVTNRDGRFLLYSERPGEYRLRADGDGLRSATFPQFSLDVDAEKGFRLLMSRQNATVDLTAAELIGQVCEPGSVTQESGVILGVVRDETGRAVGDADVIVSWAAVSGGLRGLMQGDALDDIAVAVATDSAGFYAACGVPGGLTVRLQAVRDGMLSDFSAVRFVPGGVQQGGTLHDSPDHLWVQELRIAPRELHTAGLAGTILASDTRLPVANARVALLGTNNEVVTDTAGEFRMDNLPAGPGKIRVRSIGYNVIDREVDLRTGTSVLLGADLLLLAPAPTELTPIEVSTTAPDRRRPLEDFQRRREQSVGMFITRDEFMEEGNPIIPTDVLRRMGGIKVIPNPRYNGVSDSPRYLIVISRTASRGSAFSPSGSVCAPIAFLDGHYLGLTNTFDVDQLVNLEHVYAVEAYGSAASMPLEFKRPGSQCGVVAFWTR